MKGSKLNFSTILFQFSKEYTRIYRDYTDFRPGGASLHCPAESCPRKGGHNSRTYIQLPAYRTAGGAACRARRTRQNQRGDVPEDSGLFF